MVRFEIFRIDKGGGRTPRTLTATGPIARGEEFGQAADGSFATKQLAERASRELRNEFADRSVSVGVRPVPTAEQVAAKTFTRTGEEIIGPPPKGRTTTRSPEEQAAVEQKSKALADINSQIRDSTGKDRQSLIRERDRISNVRVTAIPGTQITSQRLTQIERELEQARREPKVTTRTELIRQRQATSKVRQQRLLDRLEQKRLRDEDRGQVVRVSTGPQLIESTLSLRPSGGVAGFQQQEVEERKPDLFGAQTITVAPRPKGIIDIAVSEVSKKEEELLLARLRGDPKKLQELVVGGSGVLIRASKFGKELLTNPLETTKALGIGLATVGKKLVTGEGFPEVGPALKAGGGITVGKVAGEILFFKGTQKIIQLAGKGTELGITRISPKFRGVETTPLGEKIIKDIPKVDGGKFELGLIPKGSKPTLDVDPLKLVKESKIPLETKPKVPKLTKVEKKIVSIAQAEGDIFTGSFGQKVLVKGSREFADIDILSKNPLKTVAKIKREVKEVKVKKVKITDSPQGSFDIFRVTERRTGKVIADIDPLGFAEEGFATKFPTIRVGGLEFVAPEARLAAKATQLARGKRKSGKVIKDIGILTGRPGLERSPLLRGAFGFTRAEQAEFIGQKGIVTTSARDLFKLGRGKVDVSGVGLFATPPEILKKLPKKAQFGLVEAKIGKRKFILKPQKLEEGTLGIFREDSGRISLDVKQIEKQALVIGKGADILKKDVAFHEIGHKTDIHLGVRSSTIKGLPVAERDRIKRAADITQKALKDLYEPKEIPFEFRADIFKRKFIEGKEAFPKLPVFEKKLTEGLRKKGLAGKATIKTLPRKVVGTKVTQQRAITRTTRLALEQREATLTDILTGDISFRRKKPQIIFFEDVEIGKEFKLGLPSSELEVVLPSGTIIQKQKTAAVTIIEKRRVPIIRATIVTEGSDTANKLAGVSKELQKDIAKAQIGSLSESQAAKVSKTIRKETGLDIGFQSRQPRVKPFVSPTRLGTGLTTSISRRLTTSKIPTVAPRISRGLSARPSRRVSARPSIRPSIPPSIIPSLPPSIPPSAPPSVPPSVPPSLPPSAPPSVPPSVPPSLPPSAPPSVPPLVPPFIPPRLPPPGVPPFIPKLGRGFQKKPTFNVQVREGERRGDKFKVVAKNLPKNKALRFGSRIVDNFIEASFRIRPTGRSTTIPDISRPNLSKFRARRPGTKLPSRTFVEKRRHRLDTVSEVNQISFFKSLKARRGVI